jgi:uncharacterized surface protein with fasciclin (FAS1) repeats
MPSHRLHALLLPSLLLALTVACEANPESAKPEATPTRGAASVRDDVSAPDVVKIAVNSPDHTTLVTALQAAGLVDVMSATGPYTVFAPTNAAFDKLPAGTVADLLKPENKSKLSRILQHHVTTSALDLDFFEDGQEVGMVDGTRATFTRRGTDAFLDGAKILASVRATNGWVHVIDAVVLPKS